MRRTRRPWSKPECLRSGERLRPSSTATTVRAPSGKAQVVNGPYADVKEQFGGFYVIEVADLDEAIKWAARCPSAQWRCRSAAGSGRDDAERAQRSGLKRLGERGEDQPVKAYGHLLAHLATKWRDVASAEDALAEAFEAALTNWSERGVPENPIA